MVNTVEGVLRDFYARGQGATPLFRKRSASPTAVANPPLFASPDGAEDEYGAAETVAGIPASTLFSPGGSGGGQMPPLEDLLTGLLPGAAPPTKPNEPQFRRGDYTMEAMPSAPTLPSAPTRDFDREGRDGLNTGLIAAVIGALMGGGRGALAAFSGATGGYRQGANEVFGTRRENWKDTTDGLLRDFSFRRQSVQDKNQQTLSRQKSDEDYNRTEADRFRTETGAYNQQLGIFQRAKAAKDTNDRLTQQAKDKATAEGEEKTRKERADFFDFLADLDEPSQQQALQLAEQSGDLERLGIHLTQGQDGRYQFNLRKAPPQKAEESPEAIRRGQVEDDLRELYRVFNNPKLNAAGQKKIAERIARRQAELGISAEEGSLAGVLDEMTPYQRETLKQANQRIEEQKRHNQKTEATAAQNAATAASRASGSGGPSATANRLERQGWLKGELSRIKNARGRLLGQLNTGKISLDFYLRKSAGFDREEDAANKKAFAEPAPAGTTGTVNFAKPTPESVANERKVKLPNGGTAILRKIAPGQPSPVKKP